MRYSDSLPVRECLISREKVVGFHANRRGEVGSIRATQVVLSGELPNLPRDKYVHFDPLNIQSVKVFVHDPVPIVCSHITLVTI